LSEIGREITFVFEPMGISENNWVATVGIFTGVLAKEAVVGTLDALYGQLETQTESEKKTAFNLQNALTDAALTVPKNLSEIANRLLDPLGLNVGNLENTEEAANSQNVKTATFSAMQHNFDGQVGAFAYLLFILLYTPCVAATAAIYRETSAGWAIFTVAWTTGIAYLTATLFYQTATFAQHPEESLLWIVCLIGLLFTVIFELWLRGQREFSDA
jgi:ferrous iron transport protein B